MLGFPAAVSRLDGLPEDAPSLARRIVASLRDVYGVRDPSFLVVRGFGDDGPWDEAELPLGLTVSEETEGEGDVSVDVARTTDDLRDRVFETVASVVDHPIEFDAGGDITVQAEHSVIWIRVSERAPQVKLFAVLLHDVQWRPRVGFELNSANAKTSFVRSLYRDGSIVLDYDLWCRPFVPELLRVAVRSMRDAADTVAVRLKARLGGQFPRDNADDLAECMPASMQAWHK